MKYAVYFFSLAALCLWAALTADRYVSRLALISFGICFAGVGLAFLIRRPALFLKNSKGRIHPAAYLVFWPYFMLNALLLHGVRCTGKAKAYDEVIPGLYLGGRLLEHDCPTCFSSVASYAVLDLTAEFSECKHLRSTEHYRCLPLLDTSAPSIDELEAGSSWIEVQHKDRPVYVHCALGNSRSATFVAAYLIRSGYCPTPGSAIELLQSKRPGVGLNKDQNKALLAFVHSVEVQK